MLKTITASSKADLLQQVRKAVTEEGYTPGDELTKSLSVFTGVKIGLITEHIVIKEGEIVTQFEVTLCKRSEV